MLFTFSTRCFRVICKGLIGIVLLSGLSGCGLIGATYGIFIDPLIPKPTIKAEHDMSGRRVLIWLESVTTDPHVALLRRETTERLIEELSSHKAAGELVSYESVMSFRNAHPDINAIEPFEIGRRLGADEVIYIAIEKFDLHHDLLEGFYSAEVSGHCRVIDSQAGRRLWPATKVHEPFAASDQLPRQCRQKPALVLTQNLSDKIVDYLAVRFYDHKQVSNQSAVD